MKGFLGFILVFCAFLTVEGQELDSVRNPSDTSKVKMEVKEGITVQDTLRNVQDTVKKETRKERKAREKAEKEHEKYYYKDIKKDSTRLAIEHLSKVAWKRSLILPGWGQYTNGGLWWIKIPVIYGGLVSAVVIFDYWQWYYKKFGDEAAYRINNNGAVKDPDFANVQQLDFLIRQKDYGRRNRDLTILATLGFWGLNVVEAYTTSILKYRYDMGDDLAIKISPTVMPSGGQMALTSSMGHQFVPGIRLTMNIK